MIDGTACQLKRKAALGNPDRHGADDMCITRMTSAAFDQSYCYISSVG